MTDLVRIMNSFVDTDGKILIKGIDELVAPLTDEEAALYPPIAFTMQDLHELGAYLHYVAGELSP